MAAKKTTGGSANPKAAEPKAQAEEAKLLRGAFCNLAKYGGEGWGISIEEDGDIEPGQLIVVKKKDGVFKPVTIKDVVHEDSYKVVCTFIPDPDDIPPGGRKGSAKRRAGGDSMGGEGSSKGERKGRGGKAGSLDISQGRSPPQGPLSDPRCLRQGRVTFGKGADGKSNKVELGGVNVNRNIRDWESLLDLG